MRGPHKSSAVVVGILFLLLSSSIPPYTAAAFAQATTGSIRGTVTDQTGAAVGDAEVVARNQETGVRSPKFSSTGSGLYAVPNLTPGKYTLIVESKGFKRDEHTDIDVRLGQDSIQDATLQPGGITEVVSVTASSESVLQRNTSQISTSIEHRRVTDLPMTVAGGGLDVLALLAPGVAPGLASNVSSNGTALSVNGSRSRAVSFNIDGQDNNDQEVAGLVYAIDNPDVVADYQVITGNLPARYGRNSAAIVNVVTKTGSNRFHGTGFGFFRDRGLFDSAINPVAAAGTTLNAPEQDYVYGGTIGGPIVRDKIFFFSSYEGKKSRTGTITLQGSPAILPAGLQQLKASFPNNPAIGAIANFTAFAITDFGTVQPNPALALTTVTIGSLTLPAAFPQRTFRQPFDESEFTGRVDFKVSDKDFVWARYLFQNPNLKNALGDVSGFTGDLRARTQTIGGSWDRQISSHAINTFTFAYSRFRVALGGGCAGLMGCIPDPLDNGGATLTQMFTPLGEIGPSSPLYGFTPQGRRQEVFQFGDNLALTKGKHQFVFGADIRRLRSTVQNLPFSNGLIETDSTAKLITNTPDREFVAVGQSPNRWLETDQFYYFQDDWKLRDNLTLNLGLRYEYANQPINRLHDLTVQRESSNASAFWDPAISLADRTVPRIPTDKHNFAPRAGFAYTPRLWKSVFGSDATVIRGGYTIAYDPSFNNILDNVAASAPTGMVLGLVPCITSSTPCVGPFPLLGPIPTGTAVQSATRAALQGNRLSLDPRLAAQTRLATNFHSPYTQQWSLGIERKVATSGVVGVRYLGNHSVGLFQTANTNPLVSGLLHGLGDFTPSSGQKVTFPAFPNLVPSGVVPSNTGRLTPEGSVLTYENTAQSSYHSLQSSYYGRLLNQVTLGASYTFSKALDNASDVFLQAQAVGTSAGSGTTTAQKKGLFLGTGGTVSVAQDPFNTNRAEKSFSAFDRRHVLCLNGIWDLPLMRGQRGLLGHLLGGWQLNGVYELASGQRYTPVQGFTFFPSYVDNFLPITDPKGSLTFGFIENFNRPFTGNPNANPSSVGISQVDAALAFGKPVQDPNGFYSLGELNRGRLVPVSLSDVRYVLNGPGADRIFGSPFGDVARNSQKGPPINIFNAGFFKNTRIRESMTFQFRVEVFNLLNHPNPGYGDISGDSTPDQFVNDAGFGFNDRSLMVPARRSIQFGIKVIF